MKLVDTVTYENINRGGDVKTSIYYHYIVNCCSLRRAKKLARGMYLKGTYKKKCIQWVHGNGKASYSKRNRRFYLFTVRTTIRVNEND